MTRTARAAIFVLFCSMTALFPGLAAADRGSKPFLYGAEIYEPAQNAIVAWNGQEELLILSTDLRATQPTKVLEVLPLPPHSISSRRITRYFFAKARYFFPAGAFVTVTG